MVAGLPKGLEDRNAEGHRWGVSLELDRAEADDAERRLIRAVLATVRDASAYDRPAECRPRPPRGRTVDSRTLVVVRDPNHDDSDSDESGQVIFFFEIGWIDFELVEN